MALPSLGGAGPAPIRGTPGASGPTAGGPRFAEVLKGPRAPAAAQASTPQQVTAHHQVAAKAIQKVGAPHTVHAASQASVIAPPPAQVPTAVGKVGHVGASALVERVSQAQARMENVLKLAQSGKDFSPAELLSLQTQAYQASQELDLAGKVVEKATNGVKQVLQTQV